MSRLKPNKHLSLKLRFMLHPDRWEKRGAAEKLARVLAGKRGGDARDVDADYAAGLVVYRSERVNAPSGIEALRRAHAKSALVGPNESGLPRQGADLDTALRKWLERAEYWEAYHVNDERWRELLKVMLR